MPKLDCQCGLNMYDIDSKNITLYNQVKKSEGRLKKTWMEVIRQDIKAKGLNEGILLDRNEW